MTFLELQNLSTAPAQYKANDPSQSLSLPPRYSSLSFLTSFLDFVWLGFPLICLSKMQAKNL